MTNLIETTLKDRETSQLFMKYSNKTFEFFKKRCFAYVETSDSKIKLTNVSQTTEKGNLFKITFSLRDNDTTFKIAYYYNLSGKIVKRGFEEVNIGSILSVERFRKANRLCNELVKL